MASRYSSNQRVSRHSEHDDRFESSNSRNNERSSRRFDEYAKNRDITSKYDEDSSRLQRTSSFNDKGTTKFYDRKQKYSKNDDELQENLENKIKFQESFGIERRSSKRFDQENLKNTKKVVEESQTSTTTETSNVGQFKDLRQLLQSKRQHNQAENDKISSMSSRLGPKIKEEVENSQFEKKNLRMDEKFDDKPTKSGRNPSRICENSARLVNKLLSTGRRPAKVDEKSDEKALISSSSKVDKTLTTSQPETLQESSEVPQPRVRKPIRIRNPANRLADLVRNQVVDAVKRNEKHENSTSSKSEKSASNESLIEILSSSDDAKVVIITSSGTSTQKELDTAMDRLKTDFDDVSSSGSENWVDIVDEEKNVKPKPKVDLKTKITAALRQGNCKVPSPTQKTPAQVDKITNKHVHFEEPIKPEPKNLQRSSSMSSLAENKPRIQRNQSKVEPQKGNQQRPEFESRQSNRQLQRTHSSRFHGPQQGRMQRNNFEAPQSIRPDIANSKEFQQFRFAPMYDHDLFYHNDGTLSTMPELQNMITDSNQFRNSQRQMNQTQNQSGWCDSTNWRSNYENITSNSYQETEEPQKISVIVSNYPQDHQSTTNYQEMPNLTSNYQEVQHLTLNTQNISVLTSNQPQIPDLYKYPPPTLHPSQFQPQNQFINSNIHKYINQESARLKQRTPSPAPSSSSSSSSSATDLFGAPSKLEARLKKIQGNEKKFSDGNKSSSLESLKSNGFNANAQVFYPKQTDVLFVPYQQQVEITEPVYYDSHHSFELSAYVDESSAEEEEPSNKLTHEQMINLLYVTKTSEKYMNEALSYYVEYYDELGYNLSKNAVDDVLTAKGIENKACDFKYEL
ncbi:hypothetical protein ACKWTF_015547 [Chironomus riparius]